MDELDKKLFKDLSEKVEIPIKCEYIIKNAFNNKRKHCKSMKNIMLIAIKVCGVIFLTTGVVLASTKVYESIWKNPKKVENFFDENSNKVTENINTNELNAISKDEAITKFYDILNKFGYNDEVIESIELFDNPADDGLYYRAITKNKFQLDIDAKDTKNFKIVTNILYKDIDNYRGTQQEAEDEVERICKKYGYDLSKYNHKEVDFEMPTSAYNRNISEKNPNYANRWNIKYNKEYNGIINKYEEINIEIIPEINELSYFIYTDRTPENTEIIINEQEAKNIAVAEEKKLNIGYDINNVTAQLDIVGMNGYAYLREHDFEKYYESRTTENYPLEDLLYYQVEDRIRQVWLVKLDFETTKDSKYKEENFTYFIDTETGEIIGGY